MLSRTHPVLLGTLVRLTRTCKVSLRLWIRVISVLLAICANAWALVPSITSNQYNAAPWGADAWNTDPLVPCASRRDFFNGIYGYVRFGEWVGDPISGNPLEMYCPYVQVFSSPGVYQGTGALNAQQLSVMSVTSCPANSTVSANACICNSGFQEDATGSSCQSAAPEPRGPMSCKAPVAGSAAGRPILPATAEKFRSESDWTDAGPAALSLVRTY